MDKKASSQRSPSRGTIASTSSSKTAMTSTPQVNANCVKDLLTEENLARYQTSLDESITEAWSNHLRREEGCRNFFSALGESRKVVSPDFGVVDETRDLIDNHFRVLSEMLNDGSEEAPKSIEHSLKMFIPPASSRGGNLPLERSLTPGFNDPTYFAVPALTDMKILHGDSEGISERTRIAKMHVQVVLEAKPKKKSSMKTVLSHPE